MTRNFESYVKYWKHEVRMETLLKSGPSLNVTVQITIPRECRDHLSRTFAWVYDQKACADIGGMPYFRNPALEDTAEDKLSTPDC
ncbi:hypothetical protein BO70DRAFT_122317 [Aspergillus heteromorphus CBS 117.55]|uniref:Uncharacterized protein n=1 Tax=Aspergillus heteromorphus CBS 117.55 TaxID=1448321 RepID=A0A317VCM9_9EURO|nr:uncharacterized protein BO70DRAFT_122317 [Aspergillus heteromorphus CBS 117.55]PWY71745.1 hypothetical protein BO70DRAFT_122317 [Aspergillus heteromorphus CBS 117.55]